MEQIDGIERETGPSPDLSIIWLHGLGADATDFLPIVPQLVLPTATRFVFPNAPQRPITINGGLVMRAWFDVLGPWPDAPEDVASLRTSVAIVTRLVEREIERGIEPGRVVLAGFSQGGAVALHAGLGFGSAVGGIVGLSTWLPAAGLFESEVAMRTDVPVLLAHGTHDAIIPLELARLSAKVLTDSGVAVDWSTWQMAHEVRLEEIAHLNLWFERFASH
jgi:phospholipase/carboxylesterase